ncbi:MAG TPA: GAF domain-containing protein [Candidatus Binataceae bacterium]|nr:GAF domain-containing protein [Candidatus Binataceae bacterium]
MKRGGLLERFRDKFLIPWWSRYLAFPIVESAPAAFATLWFGLGNSKLYGYSAPLVFLATALWAGAVAAGRSALSEYAAFSVSQLVHERNRLLRLLGLVRAVVAFKSRRFHDHSEKVDQSIIDPGQVFLAITQPEAQIREILRATHDFFLAETEVGETIHVSIMEWDEQKGHLRFINYYPDGDSPRAPESAFHDATTIAGQAYFNNKMLISENLREDPNYQPLGDPADGSMLAYPVYDDRRHKVVLVANVRSRVR